jgi:hypothetical protein
LGAWSGPKLYLTTHGLWHPGAPKLISSNDCVGDSDTPWRSLSLENPVAHRWLSSSAFLPAADHTGGSSGLSNLQTHQQSHHLTSAPKPHSGLSKLDGASATRSPGVAISPSHPGYPQFNGFSVSLLRAPTLPKMTAQPSTGCSRIFLMLCPSSAYIKDSPDLLVLSLALPSPYSKHSHPEVTLPPLSLGLMPSCPLHLEPLAFQTSRPPTMVLTRRTVGAHCEVPQSQGVS